MFGQLFISFIQHKDVSQFTKWCKMTERGTSCCLAIFFLCTLILYLTYLGQQIPFNLDHYIYLISNFNLNREIKKFLISIKCFYFNILNNIL